MAVLLFVGAAVLYFLPYQQGSSTNIVSGLIVAMLAGGGSLTYRAFAQKETPEHVKRHWKELRDKAFRLWLEAEVITSVRGSIYGVSGEFSAHAPIFWTISKRPYYVEEGRAFQHLRVRQYRDPAKSLGDCLERIEAHNALVYKRLDNLWKDVDVALAKFPSLVELGKGTDYYVKGNILEAVESNSEFHASGPDVYGGNNVIAFIRNESVRDSFYGEMRSLGVKHADLTEDLDRSLGGVQSRYDDFRGLMARIIESIETLGRLDGKCEVEQGKPL